MTRPWLLCLPLLALAAGQAQVVDIPVDDFADTAAWSLNADGGAGLTWAHDAAAGADAPGAMHLTYAPADANAWANLVRAVEAPDDWLAVRFRLQIVSAAAGAAMHLWLFESDGDGHVTQVMFDGQPLARARRGVWHEVRVPVTALRYDPRGDGTNDLSKVNRLMLGFNYSASEVLVDDLQFESGPPPVVVPLVTSDPWAPEDGPRGRLALLAEPGLTVTAGGFDPAALAPRLRAAGFGVTLVRAGDLADAARLNRDTFDILLLNAPDFPLAARDGLRAYLAGGGAFLSLGGYAFDRPVAATDGGWVPLMAEQPDNRINARYGQPGDTMNLDSQQIGLFDPTSHLTRVASATLGDLTLLGDYQGMAGVSLAGLNSPVFPTAQGTTEPLGQAYDSLGRPRGALGILVQFYAGPYAGGAWGGFGVTNRDLFADDEFGLDPLLEACDKLVRGVYLGPLTATPARANPGETVTLSATVYNRGRRPANAQVRFTSGLLNRVVPVTLAPGEDTTLSMEGAAGLEGITAVEARLSLDEVPWGEAATEFVVWDPTAPVAGRQIGWQGNYMTVNGRPTFLTGTNQTGVMWATTRENPLTWNDDFAAMADAGLTIWRVLHWSAHATFVDGNRTDNPLMLADAPPEKLIRETDAIVYLAQRHGLILMLTAHDWMELPLSDEELAAQRSWNRFWADRYRTAPGLIWDLQNEPSVTVDANNPVHVELFRRYLVETHGSEAAARTWLGLDAQAELRPVAGDGSWGDLQSVALYRFRTWLLRRWINENVAGLREGNPNSLVTVGYLQSRPPADKIGGQVGLDFANMHSYEPPRDLLSSLRFIDRRPLGQGLSMGEFGARNLHDLRVNGGDGEAGDQDRRRFVATLGTVLGAGGMSALNWCFRGLPDTVFPWELFRADRVGRPTLADFQALTLFSRGLEPVYQPPSTYLLLPDHNRLGGRFNELDAAWMRAIEALHSLAVPYAPLPEEDLTIPAEADTIVWPLPYGPDEATFQSVEAWVRAGGQLLLTGDVGFNDRRQYTMGDRLARLGLPATRGLDPFSAPSTEAAPVSVALGAGRVTFIPAPLELGSLDQVRAAYDAFLTGAGAPRLVTTPEDDAQFTAAHGADGSTLWVAANWSLDGDRPLTVGGVTMQVQADSAGLALLAADGAVLGFVTSGDVSQGDVPLVRADGPLTIAGTDGAPLLTATSLVVAPLGATTATFATQHAWTAPVASIGLVRDGAWQELARRPVAVQPGWLEVELGEDLLETLVVIAEPAEQDAAQQRVVDRMGMR